MLGESGTARDVARQNISAFPEDCDAVVTLCASCASHLKHGYANLLGDESAAFSEKVTDFASFVHDRLGLDSFDIENSSEKVAYHASCHLCRELGVKDAPRAILKAAASYVPSAEEETCCGFGGTFSAKFPEISAALMEKKLANVSASGARRLALDCPGCAMQIGGGSDRNELGVKVSHIAEVLAESIRLHT
jgi:Fe-S oxidoreductase